MTTETKHTPGPWKERIEHLDKGNLGKERVVRLIVTENPSWETICEMRWDAQEESFGHMIANARLIAAAPDLLKALKRLEFAVLHGNGAQAWQDIKGEARAAIAKATE